MLAEALSGMAALAQIIELPNASENPADKPRTAESGAEAAESNIMPLTSQNVEQSQRDSNPCLHLERVMS